MFLHFHSCSSFYPVPLFLLFLPYPAFSSPLLPVYLLSLFSLSLGDNTKWPTRVDMSLNPNTVNQSLWANSTWQIGDIFLIFPQKTGFYNSCKLSPLILETICMKCQNLFSGKNKEYILKCHLLIFLPRVLSVKNCQVSGKQCRPRSGLTLFTPVCQPKYLGWIWVQLIKTLLAMAGRAGPSKTLIPTPKVWVNEILHIQG